MQLFEHQLINYLIPPTGSHIIKHMYKRYLILILYLILGIAGKSMATTTASPLGEGIRHHVIIAIDKAGCGKWAINDEVAQKVNKWLSDTGLTGEAPGRQLFEDGDFISIVGFAMNELNTDIKMFVAPIQNLNYKSFKASDLSRKVAKQWSEWVQAPHGSGSSPYSLVSVAKPYSLMALKSDSVTVNRTFLIMVTDHHYNGNNFYDEIVYLIQMQKQAKIDNPVNKDTILEKCYKVEQNYFIKFRGSKYISVNNYQIPKGYIELYEFVPLQQNFALSSAMEFPSHLTATRLSNGKYQVTVPVKWRNNTIYKLEELDVFLTSADTPQYSTPSDAIRFSGLDTTFTFEIFSKSELDHLAMRAWVRLNDGVYNATVMSPTAQNTIESGRDGLNVLIPIEREKKATVYGIPLESWAWPSFIESQYLAANIWEFLILFIPLVAVSIWLLWYFSRPFYYRPREGDFKLISKKNNKS